MNFHSLPARFLFWVTISSFNMVKKIAGRLCEDAESSFYFILILDNKITQYSKIEMDNYTGKQGARRKNDFVSDFFSSTFMWIFGVWNNS